MKNANYRRAKHTENIYFNFRQEALSKMEELCQGASKCSTTISDMTSSNNRLIVVKNLLIKDTSVSIYRCVITSRTFGPIFIRKYKYLRSLGF